MEKPELDDVQSQEGSIASENLGSPVDLDEEKNPISSRGTNLNSTVVTTRPAILEITKEKDEKKQDDKHIEGVQFVASFPYYFQSKDYKVVEYDANDDDKESSVVSSILSFTKKKTALGHTGVPSDALSRVTLRNTGNHHLQYVEYQGAEKNREIVISNIRHFLVLFWILVYANLMVICAFMSSIYSIVFDNWNVFSIGAIMTYLLVTLVLEIILSIIITTIAALRVVKFKQDSWKNALRIGSILFFLHYPAILTVLGTNMYLSLIKLRRRMELELDDSIDQGITKKFSSTQTKRRCCGINSFNDWHLGSDATSEWTTYPLSCCPDDTVQSEGGNGTCYQSDVFETGCYDVEFKIIAWHAGWVLGLIALGCCTIVGMLIQVNRLIEYLKRFSSFRRDKEKSNDHMPSQQLETEVCLDEDCSRP